MKKIILVVLTAVTFCLTAVGQKPNIDYTQLVNGSLIISKGELIKAGGINVTVEGWEITSYKFTSNTISSITITESCHFTNKMIEIIKHSNPGDLIVITNIKAKKTNIKEIVEKKLNPLVITIK